ncbi:lysophospholipid acyltransferase family protein [Streptomyces sp. NPDC048504]|uniref:lysophospholipid acyltransferase family protein n=1 Tax=Streptomyces sp. NPDC048504 TaxID=3365559 RepID=UPI0037122170
MIYPEGGLPRRGDSADRGPGSFRTGLARLAVTTGAPVVPLGHAGARRIVSGGRVKQIAGVVTAPLRRPDLHVRLGEPVHLTGDIDEATARARTAVEAAWQQAVGQLPSSRRASNPQA